LAVRRRHETKKAAVVLTAQSPGSKRKAEKFQVLTRFTHPRPSSADSIPYFRPGLRLEFLKKAAGDDSAWDGKDKSGNQ
jgi:hypothetical protein